MAASGSARKRLALSRPAPRKTSSLLVPSNRHLEKNRVLSRSDNMMTDGSGIEAAPDGSTAAPSITVNPLKRASGKKIEKRRAKHTAWRKQLEAAREQRLHRLKEAAQKKQTNSSFAADALFESLEIRSTSTPQQATERASLLKQSKPRKALGNPQKNRARLLQQETLQFSRVLGHPQFKADPAGAIRQHVINKIQQELSQ